MCVEDTYIHKGRAERRSELGGSIVTMVPPAESLQWKDPTRASERTLRSGVAFASAR